MKELGQELGRSERDISGDFGTDFTTSNFIIGSESTVDSNKSDYREIRRPSVVTVPSFRFFRMVQILPYNVVSSNVCLLIVRFLVRGTYLSIAFCAAVKYCERDAFVFVCSKMRFTHLPSSVFVSALSMNSITFLHLVYFILSPDSRK